MGRIDEDRQHVRMLGIFVGAWLMMLSGTAGAEPTEAIRIAGSGWIGDAPTWVASELDLFNQQRSAEDPVVEVDLYGSGMEALEALLAGQADLALAATTPTARALAGLLNESGGTSPEIVVLASVALSNQSHYIIAPDTVGIRQPDDFAGQRIGVMKGTSAHYGWSRFSLFHGLSADDVSLVDVPVSDMANALLEGQIDAAVIWQPWDLTLREELDDEVTVLPMRMLHTVNWLLLASTDFVNRHPGGTERILKAYIEAIEHIDVHPGKMLALFGGIIGHDPEVLEPLADRMLWRVGMNWSVLVNLGIQFEWLSTWPGLSEHTFPKPRRFLHAEPLHRVAPTLVTLPDYLMSGHAQPGTEP
ncbi:NrtA/SsuA/CpmA family ABC transporter substrate-binding protein [Wenzhouxiangella sp. AB-CW3]|uniref:ABC transporter substrate-binding protein n=1 Tax=Wenzhouxiangella sp. AB-CW3 TaxID=2771012 RepID=UPI00168B1DE8|nr:NrtA/SsuA/CpmA family ABC transporter substrate-binding protein [Wenzhouxiangella sp. AB-CW3]QOC22200.1 NrtA/SsuA/CpmA family ABC transporter substrate-binding protein [Wenzhouxiangella sp. AB-CW3]